MSLPAVILAAGASRRLGRPKQSVEVDGEALLHRAARAALEAGLDPVFIILGAGVEALEPLIANLPVEVIPNPHWEEGMSSSIRVGLQAIPPTARAVVLLVCDQIHLEAAVLERLIQAFHASPTHPAACFYEGTLGVPAIFPCSAFAELTALRGDKGARLLLRQPGVTPVAWPEGKLDLDDAKVVSEIEKPR